MTHKTKGIVLRSIKYGETSLVVTIFTELFGIQTYLVNGVRSSKKTAHANYYQPAAVLDLVVYHNEQRNLQRIKEVKWDFLFQHVLSDVVKNSVALYIIELLHKCLKQPEENATLFYFCEEVLIQLDGAGSKVTSNFALYFSLQLPEFLGFKINDDYSDQQTVLDLSEGGFVSEEPTHPHFIKGDDARWTSQLLKVMQPAELTDFQLNHVTRRRLLMHFQDYYSLHIADFGQMKTLGILHEVLAP